MEKHIQMLELLRVVKAKVHWQHPDLGVRVQYPIKHKLALLLRVKVVTHITSKHVLEHHHTLLQVTYHLIDRTNVVEVVV
jgi:hypothetical protein